MYLWAPARIHLRRLPGALSGVVGALRRQRRLPARDSRDPGPRARPREGRVSPRARAAVFLIGAAGLAALLGWGIAGLAPFGDFAGAYGTLLPRVEPQGRHAANVVAAVGFDYRGFDTLGEELVLFSSVIGLA